MSQIPTSSPAYRKYMQPASTGQKEKDPNPDYLFKGNKFKQALKEVKGSTDKINPVSETKNFKNIVSERGYPFFDPRSMSDWMKTYGGTSPADIQKEIDDEYTSFMHAVKTPGHPEHNDSRKVFLGFDQNENAVRKYAAGIVNEKHGNNIRPIKDIAYEQRQLKALGPITNQAQGFEQKVYSDLMQAKWNAVGYDGDEEYTDRFKNDYCLAY